MQRSMVTRVFDWRGRLSRRGFWWGFIALWAAFAVLFVFLSQSLGRGSTLVLYPPFLWIATCLLLRRLHDRDRSAGWLTIALIPILGPLWLLATLGWGHGTRGDNRFGPDPNLVNVDYLTVRHNET